MRPVSVNSFIATEAMMRSRQLGQVLPIGLVLLALGVMGALVLYNTGQVATDKMTLANTADAAAYSGSQWQARALNFQSYSNRAMVANQVSIAQAVTLQSWVTYGAVASQNIATVLKPVPFANVLASGLETGLLTVEKIMTPVSKAMLGVVDVVNRGLSTAQQAMFVSTFVATPDVVKAVVDQSDERFSINTGFSGIGIANNLKGWRSFTQGFDNKDIGAMKERAHLVNQSRDDFTRQRDWKFFKNIWFYYTPLLRYRFYREGKTELIQVDKQNGTQWEWKAKDTMSLHARVWRLFGTKRYEVPIGWAEAFANTQERQQTIEPGACTPSVATRNCARFLVVNKRAEYWADIGLRAPVKQTQTQKAMKGYTGLQAFRSLSTDTIENGTSHLQLKVEVALPAEHVNSSATSGMRGSFSAPVGAPGNRISSISVAEVFYQRPDVAENPDQALEKANGYNPYWAARLAPIAAADRLLAFALRPKTQSAAKPDGLPRTSDPLASYQDLPADFKSQAASFETAELGEFKDAITHELNDVLKSAVEEMLKGAFQEQISGATQGLKQFKDKLEQSAEDKVAELVTDEMRAPYDAAVEEAERIAATLLDEFKRVRTQISKKFEEAVKETKSEVQGKADSITAYIEKQLGRLDNPSLNEKAKEAIKFDIAHQRNARTEVWAGLKTELAEQLVEIVSETTDVYVMPYKDALYTVEEWLRSEEEEMELPWLDTTDDEDDEED